MSIVKLQEEIEKDLECRLCLRWFYKPKLLRCNHIYCKACLDKLLEFNVNGSACIKCPRRCEVVTRIMHDKTTSDLGTNFCVQGIVSKIKKKHETHQVREKCCEQMCNGRISVFCYDCVALLCRNCQNTHSCNHEASSQVSIKFDQEKEVLAVICDEHKTSADFVCCEQECSAKFICLYCVERNHKNHCNERVDMKCVRIKKWLENEEGKTDKGDIHLINNMLDMDKKSILDSRKLLEGILDTRILKGWLDYIASVGEEKSRLLRAFDSAANSHKETYPDTNVAGFFKKFKEMNDVVVVLKEKYAIEYLAKLASAKTNVQ